MPSKPAAPRRLYQPEADFNQRPIPVTRQPRRTWFRVHRSGSPAIQFGIGTHHRFSHAKCPFPWLYLGSTLSACLWEYFGDDVFGGRHVISAAKWDGCSLSQIEVPQLKVCAISLEATRNAMGVDKSSVLATDISIPQMWGLAVQQHPALFDGLKYSSRFIDQSCLALFDRGGMAAQLQETFLAPLNNLDAAVDWLDDRQVALV
jgi:RES domain